ncbi:hypothetical protein HanRHA438_Chr11g0499271 [Helianthus annuus]|uniref:Uncharacterized protein n=1 Tax=Helianthus annuus TaxID=4232 RepID=A0A9K3N072_HELAN|nr:hypothetical protein HanXRQr2_Chr11g0486661 [Helianthus annuus]KAJ0501264.1 hypothetical protein HanHA300_Chr11g0398791 [Helianthus annuus]KAJ0509011.1 hypothetical protein HanIR_Chr11g0523811 [Helianthus annuus]KAJ0517162.1 hypothetical protein HanHA89_Chr11g0422111 [Helianthus annuus]KAJ0685170.1 hypothetical protein HanLR1_Chr11g0399531 [Helianthus annuus]
MINMVRDGDASRGDRGLTPPHQAEMGLVFFLSILKIDASKPVFSTDLYAVEELSEKIERCEASAYQKLLIRRVGDNLGAFGVSKKHEAFDEDFTRFCYLQWLLMVRLAIPTTRQTTKARI